VVAKKGVRRGCAEAVRLVGGAAESEWTAQERTDMRGYKLEGGSEKIKTGRRNEKQKRGVVQDDLRKDAGGWVSTFCVPWLQRVVVYRCNFTRRIRRLAPCGIAEQLSSAATVTLRINTSAFYFAIRCFATTWSQRLTPRRALLACSLAAGCLSPDACTVLSRLNRSHVTKLGIA
jgi:hypothetical protein